MVICLTISLRTLNTSDEILGLDCIRGVNYSAIYCIIIFPCIDIQVAFRDYFNVLNSWRITSLHLGSLLSLTDCYSSILSNSFIESADLATNYIQQALSLQIDPNHSFRLSMIPAIALLSRSNGLIALGSRLIWMRVSLALQIMRIRFSCSLQNMNRECTQTSSSRPVSFELVYVSLMSY